MLLRQTASAYRVPATASQNDAVVSAVATVGFFLKGVTLNCCDSDVGLYKRYVASSDFGIVPSPIGLRRLCDYNVRWYFYDHSVSVPRASWELYASAEISNVSATLLKLRCPE